MKYYTSLLVAAVVLFTPSVLPSRSNSPYFVPACALVTAASLSYACYLHCNYSSLQQNSAKPPALSATTAAQDKTDYEKIYAAYSMAVSILCPKEELDIADLANKLVGCYKKKERVNREHYRTPPPLHVTLYNRYGSHEIFPTQDGFSITFDPILRL